MTAVLFTKKKTKIDRSQRVLPVHVGIIMDGNGRWAKKRGLPRQAGHQAGASNFRKITRYCQKIGIKYLTVYAFSTENWKRPKEEVEALMMLFYDYLVEALRDFREENIRIMFIGDITAFNPKLQALMHEAMAISADKTGMTLNIAINYGGRDELLRAVKAISNEVTTGTLQESDITAEVVSDHLYTAGQPDPDLIIRPSGEYRTSNFLLWQSAYTEYVFMDDILWPDFSTENLEEALDEYARRNRRFGGV
ncbi:MAG: isoprenyl transferase [Clostridia bacterium]|nr:isoprenyl transferase [Clostridia bacterium]MBQ5544976.1 isoprenyl transferase [Clostridia bacterium]